MRALIVQRNNDLGRLWKRHLERLQIDVRLVQNTAAALIDIAQSGFDVVVLDLSPAADDVLAVADLIRFRQPHANIVFVTDSTFFSDGSIFQYAANARACVEADAPPQDIAAIVHHYATTAHADAARQNPVSD